MELNRLEAEHASIMAARDEREEAGEEVGYDTTDESYRRLREIRLRMDSLLDAAYRRGGEDHDNRRLIAGVVPAHLEGFYRREGFEVYEADDREALSDTEIEKYASDFHFYGPGGHGGPRILTD